MIKYMNPNEKQPQTVKENHRSRLLGLSLVLAVFLFVSVLIGTGFPVSAAPLAYTQSPELSFTSDPVAGARSSQRTLFAPPGDEATFVITFTNPNAGVTATTDSYIKVTVTPSNTLLSSPDANVSAVVGDSKVMTWSLTSPLTEDQSFTVTLSAEAPVDIVLGEEFDFEFEGTAKWDDAGEAPKTRTSAGYFFAGPIIVPQTQTSVEIAGNSAITQVVAGETITATVAISLPADTKAYTVTPRIIFQDGFTNVTSIAGDTAWVTTTTDLDGDKSRDISDGYQVEYVPFTQTTGVDIVKVYTITAIAVQDYPLVGGSIADNTTLNIQPIARWCETPGCVLDERGDYVWAETPVAIEFVRPAVLPEIVSYTYLDAGGIGVGGGQVQFVISNTNPLGNPPAYDMILNAYLPAGLNYASSNPAGTHQSGVITWTRGTLLEDTWLLTLTANLPQTIAVGTVYTVSTNLHQETYLGDYDDEGVYQEQDSISLMPGLTEQGLSQSVTPVTATMGDLVDYTIVLTQSAGTSLDDPRFVNTLPKGFHYVDGSLSVTGAGVTTATLTSIQPTDDKEEQIVWTLNDINRSVETIITAEFQARLTGLDTDGDFVYAEKTNDIKGNKNYYGDNGIALYAVILGEESQLKEVTTGARVYVYQPLMEVSSIERTDARGDLDFYIENADFEMSVKNASRYASAYDVYVCDQLPVGIKFVSNDGAITPTPKSQPSFGDIGTICWVFDEVVANQSIDIGYSVQADKETAIPGADLQNRAIFNQYLSRPSGTVGLRNYLDLPVIQDYNKTSDLCTDNCPYTVLGMTVKKSVEPAAFRPGDTLTYTISYSNTSTSYNFSDLIITDTFDSQNLIYGSTIPQADIEESQYVVWGPLTPTATTQQVQLIMEVEDPLVGIESIENQISWYSVADDEVKAQQPPLLSSIETPLAVPKLHIIFTNPITPYAGGILNYTAVYSNNGTSDGVVTMTFGYDDNLIFGSKLNGTANLIAGSEGRVFTDTLAIGEKKTLEISLTVDAPLYYTVSHITSDVLIESAGAVSQDAELSLELARPVFVLDKYSTSSPPDGVGENIDYDFHLRNTGTWTATQCVLTDTWDTNTYLYTEQDWQPDNPTLNAATYATYTKDLELLPPAMETDQSVDRLTVRIGTDRDVYTNTVALQCAEIYGQIDVLPVWAPSIETYKVSQDEIAFPGRVLTYTINYSNTGSTAEHAVITDTLPDGFDFVGCTQPVAAKFDPNITILWLCEENAGAVTWSASVVQSAYRTGQFEVWGMVTDSSSDEGKFLINKTSSVSDGAPVRPGNVVVETPIIRPRLSLTQTVGNQYPNIAPGDLITYLLTYKNRGTATARDVQIEVILPTSKVSHVSGGTYNPGTGKVIWNVNDVAAQEEGSRIVVLKALEGLPEGTTIEFGDFNDGKDGIYSISSQRIKDTDTDAETMYTAPGVVSVNPWLLEISKSVEVPDNLKVNDSITYTISYTNAGGSILSGIVVTDQLPTSLSLNTGKLPVDCVHSGEVVGGKVTCNVGSLDQGNRSGSLKIVATVVSVDGVIVNTAWVSSEQTDWVQSNSAVANGKLPFNLQIAADPAPPYVAPVEIEFTGSAEGVPSDMTYEWDFGNGTTDTGAVVDTTYSYSGTYTVVMTATNAAGSTFISTEIVVTGASDIAVAPDSVSVTIPPDTVVSRDIVVSNASVATADLKWSFAEGTAVDWLTATLSGGDATLYKSEMATITVEFSSIGMADGTTVDTSLVITSNDLDEPSVEVPVVLIVTSSSVCEELNSPSLAYNPSLPEPGQPVTFTASIASGSIPVTYTWDFGSGTLSPVTGQGLTMQATHTFTPTGSYTVVFTATNPCSAVSAKRTVVVDTDAGYKAFLPIILKK